MIPILENRLCGGAGIQEFDWTLPFCHQGTRTGDACSSPTTPATARECQSASDVGCAIPKTSDGGVCAADTECKSGVCAGGRCCNADGQSEGCVACTVSGNCQTCGEGFLKRGASCIDACECTPGCTDGECDCGTCQACEAAYFMLAGRCNPKVSNGAQCTSDSECASGSCAGGNCCDVAANAPGCTDCNFRGLCEGCAEGYTLCGHIQSNQGYGQCNVTIQNQRDPVSFTCGVGADGDQDGHPLSFSSDGYNYCGGGKCPCLRSQCYFQCDIEESCWVGSNADLYYSRAATNTGGFVAFGPRPTPAPTAAEHTPSPSPAPTTAPTLAPTSSPSPTRPALCMFNLVVANPFAVHFPNPGGGASACCMTHAMNSFSNPVR